MFIELLDPKNDYVFKRIFGHVGNEAITTNFVSSILKKKITNLKLDNNTILDKDFKDDKVGILDIKAKIDNDINCNIEMQVVDYKNIEKRILFYWSKMYSRDIKSGQDYGTLGKNIVILITNYELKSLKEIPKYITKWNIREEDFSKIVLTDVLEIYIINLVKFDEYSKNTKSEDLNKWIKFIKDPGVIDMNESNKAIKQAKEILEEISQDKREQYLADLREKYILDQREAEITGVYKGQQKEKLSIAKKMLEKGMSKETISEITDLPVEEIEKL